MISVILLAGGKGLRLGTATPKQYLTLDEKVIAHHSLDLFLDHPEIGEVVVVCAPEFRSHFEDYPVTFAQPGERRQDSLYNGLQAVSDAAQWICVHDAARPLVTNDLITKLILEGKKIGAAALGMPTKWTIKQADEQGLIDKTLDRSSIWEIQTPQIIRRDILKKGFDYAHANKIEVTDDVSLAELVNHPVKLVEGSYSNIKITTPEDLLLAQCIVQKS